MAAGAPDPVEAVLAAWNDPTMAPWHQEIVKARLFDQWPALALALHNLDRAAHPTEGDQHAAAA